MIIHPSKEEFEEWASGMHPPGGPRTWDPDRAHAYALLAFFAGWRRGLCVGRNRTYPDGLVTKPDSE